MEIVVSGTRPTGDIHLGNYVGAIRNFVRMQDEFESCFYFIADYHSLTTHPKASDLSDYVKKTTAAYLASGLDPEKVNIYIQSDVPEVVELYLIFNMMAYKGELEKVPTFKEKIKKQKQNINAGLLTYPVLMAADILIHRADKVPVGKDQEQHLEMTRNFAKRFNYLYETDYFPEPVAFNFKQELIKVPSLDGSGKMSKSDNPNSAIMLTDPPELVRKKVMRAKTDSGPSQPNQEKSEEVSNLFTLMDIVSDKETIKMFNSAYADCSIRYGDLKKQLAKDMIEFLDPIRKKMEEILGDEDHIRHALQKGTEAARESAAKTISDVRKIIGINYY